MTDWQKYHEQYEVDMDRLKKETNMKFLPSFRQWLFANGLTDTLRDPDCLKEQAAEINFYSLGYSNGDGGYTYIRRLRGKTGKTRRLSVKATLYRDGRVEYNTCYKKHVSKTDRRECESIAQEFEYIANTYGYAHKGGEMLLR